MSMELTDRIEQDLITAAKARDEIRLQVLRLLKSALKNYSIEIKGEVSPQQMLQILQKEAKKRQEAATIYASNDRKDLAEKEQAELSILEEYLPAMPSEAEVRSAAQAIIQKDNLQGMQSMGKILEQLRSQFDGVIDNAQASRIVREELN